MAILNDCLMSGGKSRTSVVLDQDELLVSYFKSVFQPHNKLKPYGFF